MLRKEQKWNHINVQLKSHCRKRVEDKNKNKEQGNK